MLTEYEQVKSEAGQDVDCRQSWLVLLDNDPNTPELSKRKASLNQ